HIEVGLHRHIRTILQKEFGDGERGWWEKGIPLNIRKKCAERREEDIDRASGPYAYTDLIDLHSILDKQWKCLGETLPPSIAKNKREFLAQLEELNRIRRIVMHPVRGRVPKEEEFEFVRALKASLKKVAQPHRRA